MVFACSTCFVPADVSAFRELVRDDREAEDALDRALQGRQGARTDLVDNGNEVERPTGNTRDYALRRLRKDRPDLLRFVISANVHRRHLDETQRALIGARLATLGEGRPAKTRSIDLVSQTEAAALVNVSVPTIKRARVVLDSGDADLIAGEAA